MAVTTADLRRLVNTTANDDPVLQSCLTLAESLVTTYTTRVEAGLIPEPVLDEAVLLTAADQFHRRKAPNGIVNQQFASQEGTVSMPIRVGRDPYAAMRPLLRPWVGGGVRSVALMNPLDG